MAAGRVGVWVLGLGLLGSGLLTGCSESTGEAGLPADEAIDELVAASCDAVTECLGAASEVFLGGSDCEDVIGPAYEDSVGDLTALVEEGRVHYDGTKLEACTDALRDSGCEALEGQLPTVCDEAVQGTAAKGGDCDIDLECEGDAFCAFDGATCPGSCKALRAKGKRCESDSECDRGLACQDGECIEPAGQGDACGGGSEPECSSSGFCAGEDFQTGDSGNCVTFDEVFVHGKGEACDLQETEWCEEGLVCAVDGFDFLTMGLRSSCREVADKDGACSLGAPASCPAGQYCNADLDALQFMGDCVDLPGEGKPCLEGLIAFTVCAPGLSCVGMDTDEPHCEELARLGEKCGGDDECVSSRCISKECVPGNACN